MRTCDKQSGSGTRGKSMHFSFTRTSSGSSIHLLACVFTRPTLQVAVVGHQGRVWERCIRTVRKVGKAILNEQHLHDEGLIAVVCEAEAIVNVRPLTKVSDDPRDPESLTPNHLLLLRSGPTLPLGVFSKGNCYSRRKMETRSVLS